MNEATGTIATATERTTVASELKNALAEIGLQRCKEDAIDEINEPMVQPYNELTQELKQKYNDCIADINNATTEEEVEAIKLKALETFGLGIIRQDAYDKIMAQVNKVKPTSKKV